MATRPSQERGAERNMGYKPRHKGRLLGLGRGIKPRSSISPFPSATLPLVTYGSIGNLRTFKISSSINTICRIKPSISELGNWTRILSFTLDSQVP